MTLTCQLEAKLEDLANEKEILRFAQKYSFGITLGTFNFFRLLLVKLDVIE